jgi:hypothetical protein
MTRRGFTVVELVVTSVIGVMIAGAVLTSVSAMQRARAASQGRRQAFARAEAACSRIAQDLQNVCRNADLTHVRVAITNAGAPGAEQDGLLLLTGPGRPVRGEEFAPEGNQFEVQYKVMPTGAGRAGLWRRVDPGHDEFLDGGGIAAEVAAGTASLSLQASDGTNWYEDWDSDADGVPHAVRVVVAAASDDGRATMVARRIVAIDRVPLPPADTGEGSDSGEAPAAGSTPGGAR